MNWGPWLEGFKPTCIYISEFTCIDKMHARFLVNLILKYKNTKIICYSFLSYFKIIENYRKLFYFLQHSCTF